MKPKPAQLDAADKALKAVIADYPKNVAARFFEGSVLASDRCGPRAVEAYLAQVSPNDPAYYSREHFAENPAMSFAKMAPAITVTALDGTTPARTRHLNRLPTTATA